MRVCERERLTLKVNHIKAPSVDGVATQLVKVAKQHLLDGHKVEGVGAVDADNLMSAPQQQQKLPFFQQPDTLCSLMYMPNNTMLLDWTFWVASFQDSLPKDSLRRHTWTLGAPFRILLENTLQLQWNIYCQFVILIYVLCTPEARMLLPPRDLGFLDEEVRPRIRHWIRGHRPDGRPMTHRSESMLNLVPCFMHQLMDLYAICRLSEPLPANKDLPRFGCH